MFIPSSNQGLQNRTISSSTDGTYQSASRLVHKPLATERYQWFGPVSGDTRLYQAVMVEIDSYQL